MREDRVDVLLDGEIQLHQKVELLLSLHQYVPRSQRSIQWILQHFDDLLYVKLNRHHHHTV